MKTLTIHIRYDNIPAQQKLSCDDDAGHFDMVCSNARNPFTWCGRGRFFTSIDELQRTDTQLIVVVLAENCDFWSAEAYVTLLSEPFI